MTSAGPEAVASLPPPPGAGGPSGQAPSTPTRSQALAALQQELASAGYIAEPQLAAALLLMQDLGRPLLLEGDAGVGKTEVAKVLASLRGTRLIRLQCYEGLDAHSAMYEWNYQRQLLAIKLLEQDDRGVAAKEQDIFSERYLLKRPLLEAISCEQPPVLLIDEVDRADEAFEAYLLELLSDFQLSIPELGTVKAVSVPLVVITSNGTRELSDALRRRCLYQYIDYPDYEKELAIVRQKAPQAAAALAVQIVAFVQGVRRIELRKRPGIAETLDWTAALLRLGIGTIDSHGAERLMDTLSALIKTRDDRAALPREVVARLAAAC
jgi:MoxR-like ATPase